MLRYLQFTIILLAFSGNPGCRVNLDQGSPRGPLGGRLPAREIHVKPNPETVLNEECKAGNTDSCVQLGQRYTHQYNGRDRAIAIFMNACSSDHAPGCRELAKIKEQSGLSFDRDDAKYLYERACNSNDQEACLALRRISREERDQQARLEAAAEARRQQEEQDRLERERKEKEEQARKENSDKRLNSQLGQDIQKACFDGKPGSNLRTNPGAITPKRFCDCLAILLADPATDDAIKDRYIKTLNPPPNNDQPVSKAILQQIETAAGICMKRLGSSLPSGLDPSIYD